MFIYIPIVIMGGIIGALTLNVLGSAGLQGEVIGMVWALVLTTVVITSKK